MFKIFVNAIAGLCMLAFASLLPTPALVAVSTPAMAWGGDCNPGLVGPRAPCYRHGRLVGTVPSILGGGRFHRGHRGGRYVGMGGGRGGPVVTSGRRTFRTTTVRRFGYTRQASAPAHRVGATCTMIAPYAGEPGYVWADGRCHHLAP